MRPTREPPTNAPNCGCQLRELSTSVRPTRPKRSLGQNFLVDRNAQRRIVAALGAGPTDDVVELGPGKGALTKHLLGTVGRLRLVELDGELARELRRLAREPGSTVTVVEGDITKRRLHHAFEEPERALVIGNIPYNITSPVVFRLLEAPRPRRAVLTVQSEVADRMAATPGSKQYGALSVGVQAVAECRVLFRLPPDVFRPRPKVHSAVVHLVPLRPPPMHPAGETALRHVVRACFQWRRKQLRRILAQHPQLALGRKEAGSVLVALGIAETARPEELSPARFIELAEAVRARAPAKQKAAAFAEQE